MPRSGSQALEPHTTCSVFLCVCVEESKRDTKFLCETLNWFHMSRAHTASADSLIKLSRDEGKGKKRQRLYWCVIQSTGPSWSRQRGRCAAFTSLLCIWFKAGAHLHPLADTGPQESVRVWHEHIWGQGCKESSDVWSLTLVTQSNIVFFLILWTIFFKELTWFVNSLISWQKINTGALIIEEKCQILYSQLFSCGDIQLFFVVCD